MASNKKRDRLKKFKITYFVGDYYSSEGEKEKTTTLLARSEDASFGWIEEI